MVSPSASPAPAAAPLKRSESPLFFEEREDEVDELGGPPTTQAGSSLVKTQVDSDVDEVMEDTVKQEVQADEPIAGPSSSSRRASPSKVSFKEGELTVEDDRDEITYLSGTTPIKKKNAPIKRKVVDSDDEQDDYPIQSSRKCPSKASSPALTGTVSSS